MAAACSMLRIASSGRGSCLPSDDAPPMRQPLLQAAPICGLGHGHRLLCRPLDGRQLGCGWVMAAPAWHGLLPMQHCSPSCSLVSFPPACTDRTLAVPHSSPCTFLHLRPLISMCHIYICAPRSHVGTAGAVDPRRVEHRAVGHPLCRRRRAPGMGGFREMGCWLLQLHNLQTLWARTCLHSAAAACMAQLL